MTLQNKLKKTSPRTILNTNLITAFKVSDYKSFIQFAVTRRTTTHFLFYKNTVYMKIEPQLWAYLKNICKAKIAEIVVYF